MVEYEKAGCGVVGSAPSWGGGGRQFEPGQPDIIGSLSLRFVCLTSGFIWLYNKYMNSLHVICANCNNELIRRIGWINENKILKYNHYCSLKCLGRNKRLRKNLVCLNPKCKKMFSRIPSSISPNNYCSRTCAAIINNTKYPKNPGIRKS